MSLPAGLNARDFQAMAASDGPQDGIKQLPFDQGEGSARSARSSASSRRINQSYVESLSIQQQLRQRRGKLGKDPDIIGDSAGDLEVHESGDESGNEDRTSSNPVSTVKTGTFTWVPYEHLCDLPLKNMFGMTVKNPIRKTAIQLAVNGRLEQFWMFLAVVHFVLAMPEVQNSILGCSVVNDPFQNNVKICRYTLPNWHHFIFLSLYTLEAAIKVTGLGLTGGKFAWWTHEFYNKLDILALIGYFYETIAGQVLGISSAFTLRGFRMMRILQPLGRIGVFSDLETIFHAFGEAMKPMATVLLFIWFVLILFGIMGMAVWGGASFRRRCVWADTLEIKVPEQWCKRVELWHEYPDCTTTFNHAIVCMRNPDSGPDRKGTLAQEARQHAGLDSNCGPFQVCLDVANPNDGFTSFDHLPASLLSLFQVMSGDSDVLVLWYAIESEPSMRLLTEVYFVGYTMIVIHVLINVFVAVFANIFAESRIAHEKIIELRRKGIKNVEDSLPSSSSSSCGSSSESSSLTSENTVPSQVEMAELDKPLKFTKEEEEASALNRQFKLQARMRMSEEDAKAKRFSETTQWLSQQLNKTFNKSLAELMRDKFRNNDAYDTLCFLVILSQSVSLALMGQLCSHSDSCSVDRVFEDVIENCNYFFIFDQIVQMFADGSFAQHFAAGENIFNFAVTWMTSLGLVLRLLGCSKDTIAVLRGMVILRLLRVCKFGKLKPIWLMLIKTAGSGIAVMNLVMFNTLLALICFSIGRSLFNDALDENFRQNFSSISRGYMLLLTVLTGDSWSGSMYEAMATFCTGALAEDSCDNFYVVVTALFYMSWFFYGQFLFITMFLAIILESFSVEEFMTKIVSKNDEVWLTKEEAIIKVADFQMIPDWYVSEGLIKLAFVRLSNDGIKISENQLMTLVRMVQPKTTWRLIKTCGIVQVRYWLRQSICSCFSGSLLVPYPGDEDYVRNEGPLALNTKTDEEAEVEVASTMGRHITEYMKRLQDGGMMGEVLVIAKIKNVLEHIDVQNLDRTNALIGIKILRHESIAKRLAIGTLIEDRIDDAMKNAANRKQNQNLEYANGEYRGLDMSKLDEEQSNVQIDLRNDDKFTIYRKKFRKFCFKLVHSSLFESMMLITIITSSIFLGLETPHPSIPGPVRKEVLQTADFIFSILFMVEFVSKATAFGFYTPRSIKFMSYLQLTQNRIDLFVLVMAIAEMSGAGKYIGQSTTKIIRLMKVMRPIRLLLRSEGLKAIIEALFASLKPMAYATLFLFIVCLVFAVFGMALFRNKLHSCSDMSLDGMLGQGKIECSGSYFDSNLGLFVPRSWSPPTGRGNFDTLGKSIVVLLRCLTLNWLVYYNLTQDGVGQDIQPVPGFSMVQASLYFHLFLLAGSFFGLNLFASFMCDTFYSLQGTAQLEELQWIAVKQMLKSHQPKKYRGPPKNMISAFLRQALGSAFWQNFSGFCLLLNVTFMGSAHSSQDKYFDDFLDTQNTIFFGLMCGEAGLHLVSVGPTLYVLHQGHQFDIFLISVTSATIIFNDSLRSLSQVTRILRLFKFLKQLAKDKTIANVFETVLVSTGQVVNILIVLVVLLIMLSVLAVQLFGTQANFSTFGEAFHTIFQLMFGEDFPTLWDDCVIAYPMCSKDVYDDSGKFLHVSDCAENAWAADIFFPVVLLLSNYVMLNLFVGMIMNNFAYISCKDGNGAVEDEHFIDAAFKYAQNLDPKQKGQIPLEQVYQFYNMVGKPLGAYDTTQNLGRFLCIREELRRQMNSPEDVQYSWIFNNIYTPVLEKETHLKEARFDDWKRSKESLRILEQKYFYACGGSSPALQRMGLQHMDTNGEGSGDEHAGNEGRGDEHAEPTLQETGAQICDIDVPFMDANECSAPEAATGSFTESKGIAHQNSVRGNSFGTSPGILVSGGNMGAHKGPPKRVKQVKRANRQSSSLKSIDKQVFAVQRVQNKSLEEEKQLAEMEHLEKLLLKARKEDEMAGFEAKPTFYIQCLVLLRKLVFFALSDKERNLRVPGHVRYSEIILAFLYWNKKHNIIPQKMMEQRKELVQEIRFEVAFQLIRAVCHGGIVRRRRKLAKQQASKRLRRANKMVLDGRDLASRISSEHQNKARRRKLAPLQDENAKLGSLTVYFESPDTGILKLMLCKLCKYELATGSQLADIAEQSSYVLGPLGVFELEETQIEILLSESPALMELKEHLDTIEELKSFMQEVSGLALPYLQLAAKKYRIDVGEHFENLTTLSIDALKQLLSDPYVRTILPSALRQELMDEIREQRGMANSEERGLASPEDNVSVEELYRLEMEQKRLLKEAEVRKEIEELKQKYRKREQQCEELNRIIEYSQKRAATMRLDNEKKWEINRRHMHSSDAKRDAKTIRGPASITSPVIAKSEKKADILQIWSEGEEDMEDSKGESVVNMKKWWLSSHAGWASNEVAQDQQNQDLVQNVHIVPEPLAVTRVRALGHGRGANYLLSDQSEESTALRPNTAPVLFSPVQLPGQQYDGGWCAESGEPAVATIGGELASVTEFCEPIEMMKDFVSAQSLHNSFRPVTAPESLQFNSEDERLDAALQIMKAEIQQLERSRDAILREKRNKPKYGGHAESSLSADQQEIIALARSRRDKKNSVQVDSESHTSGLLSPRDKPMRKDLLKRELEKRQRAAHERANPGQSPASSRNASRQGSRPPSRAIDIGITF